jgi:hypothetical protein
MKWKVLQKFNESIFKNLFNFNSGKKDRSIDEKEGKTITKSRHVSKLKESKMKSEKREVVWNSIFLIHIFFLFQLSTVIFLLQFQNKNFRFFFYQSEDLSLVIN